MTPIISLSHVTYAYPNSDVPALRDLSLTINKGEWVAIIGHNGSGKSTFAKLLNYLLAPTEGEIKVNDVVATEENMWTIRDMVGMVFQNPDNQFVGATVADDVAFGMENRGVPRDEMIKRVDAALAEVQMAPFADREPARLSGGQKQRVAIASVLALQPKILILDEATAMLDPTGRREMIALVHELKARMGDDLTVISITHDIDEAASADRVMVINDGELMETGVPEEIFANADQLRRFGLAVPFAEQLKEQLRVRGISVPNEYLTTEGLVKWLWQSISTK
ncbi:energy-coupling factor ABC transporter ATP-binding protein [Weissella paramesenteroides]|jgi:energy-coupling factor transport system ATP-binding protein|uniref:Energy-coupling factor ABC transporter ATP-binding protein n=1 Tax=Weissella paramesenteroides TaxID=1249 RepID=A0ABD4XG04_WEIPA|nr:energy-coupling factor ABC transporter ATP-binding protein [Weissella paramesenteroides]KAA8447360.1 energy-coupling factor ABC transporter ATP-binding protein [Weissella paramesenteroides]KAA8451192.1 energy-coupling factor ABC transporter ATP-binding protein [Weissella paramesenteroides]MBU7556397.1 energy-coupling factor ABC transporter ATP-binding protein [Weissella paramesenteroides]MDF8366559.1 energy-coupling factor ABC transporter ATP-binding protein [Weissella paramesenteroides]MDF